jgi:hypothetical protein
LLVMVKLEF